MPKEKKKSARPKEPVAPASNTQLDIDPVALAKVATEFSPHLLAAAEKFQAARRASFTSHLQHAIDEGLILVPVRDELDDAQWMKWLALSQIKSERTVQRQLRVARWWLALPEDQRHTVTAELSQNKLMKMLSMPRKELPPASPDTAKNETKEDKTAKGNSRYVHQLDYVRDFLSRQNVPTQSAREAEREAVIWLFNILQRRATESNVKLPEAAPVAVQ
jgi:hypothetical protein